MADDVKDQGEDKDQEKVKPAPKSKDTQRIKTLEQKIASLEQKNQGHDEYRQQLEKELAGLKEKRREPATTEKAAAQPTSEVDDFVWRKE